MTRDEYLYGEGDRWVHRDAEGPTADKPLGTNMDLGTGRGIQGGAKGRRIRQRKQACGAGSRDERQRLAGVGWEKSPGGQTSTPEEDVGSE